MEHKPVAWMVWLPLSEQPPQFTTDPKTPIVMAERADYICTPLYDSSALGGVKKLYETAESRLAAVESERDAIRLATIEECAKVAEQDSMIDWSKSTHGCAVGTRNRIVDSIRHLKEKS